jgi:hypothetical protein
MGDYPKPPSFTEAVALVTALPRGRATYQPDATQCLHGHPFESEDDCVLPEGWDRFMCKRCLTDAGQVEWALNQGDRDE